MDDESNETTTEKSTKKIRVLRKTLLFLLGILSSLIALLLIVSTLLIGRMEQYILTNQTEVSAPVGIVFGAGVTKDGKPYKELQARLDSGADALISGRVDVLILSGDNRFDEYNEPEAMKNYLTENRRISAEKLQVDYAGRGTYETCERAKKIFSVEKAILFSPRSHLPRAIYTCRHFGVESYGIGNDQEANNATRRELMARVKALFNIYIRGEETILGDKIPLPL